MNIIVVENAQQGAEKAFELFEKAYQHGAKHYGLATGSTPIELYTLIRHSNLDFSNCYSINLDEYIGLSPEDEHSYRYFMEQHLFNTKPFKESFVPNGLEQDEQTEISRYETLLKQYPIDLQILGLGTNAHIGFNEPGTSFEERTHKVQLAEATIQANQRFFEKKEDVPTHAYSMGLQSIMDAKEIILMAFGKAKAQAIKDLVEGPITESVPASILQKHERVTIIIDKDAAELLN
ncbi:MULTISPECIES: glucosamine-6-phosphate deaminase [unclassified Granulicatella]|uniref:glucosamine-6-phosphate deaminase n=1 Tax=unclassified Granulicatella TaxID=2630493 RepID=UPI001073E96F|nr:MULTISPECIES: glucosamine-6-phosphate deaminase [unclassified Granulicatella]MBF0779674.1 glucosamine-6-phosphate deaminase [Granulicatella sp. 19428wC4_WM01]TFU96328.1 glucosamine-6-phosphate deaminase [Granulicatella sp. WM01]